MFSSTYLGVFDLVIQTRSKTDNPKVVSLCVLSTERKALKDRIQDDVLAFVDQD